MDAFGTIAPMKLQPNPFYRRVRQAVREPPSWQKSWSGIVFRSIPLQFAKPEQITDGVGPMSDVARN